MERSPGSLVLDQEVGLLIDFRFFIIAIVAVFLSLGLGIVLGSGFLGDPILGAIRGQVEDVLSDNENLEREILELEAEQDADQSFMTAIEPVVLEGKLESEEIVIIPIEGTDGDLLEGVHSAIEEAGGRVTSEMRLSNKLDLADEGARDDLARALDSSISEAEELRTLLGQELGDRLGAAANFSPPRRPKRGDDRLRPVELIERLAGEGFLSVDGEGPAVPQDAGFVLAVGSTDDVTWPVARFIDSLASSLGGRRAPVVVVETSDSAWDVVQDLRRSDSGNRPVSTVDNAETVAGRIATALALDIAPESTGHFGIDEGAAAPIPTPTE